MEFWKPPKGKFEIRFLDYTAFQSHHLKQSSKEPWLYCKRDTYCPFCESLTNATRAYEFIEAQLDWTWH